MENEIWKDVPGYEGLYQASLLGRVKSLTRTVKGNNGYASIAIGRILKPGKHKYGYDRFSLCKESNIKYFNGHRIIALTFIPNPKKYPCINHIDNDPTNNKVENLEWCNWSQNSRHAFITGTQDRRGEKNSGSKLTEKEVMEIFNSKEKDVYLAKQYNVSYPAIWAIRQGRQWSHITGLFAPTNKKRLIDQFNGYEPK